MSVSVIFFPFYNQFLALLKTRSFFRGLWEVLGLSLNRDKNLLIRKNKIIHIHFGSALFIFFLASVDSMW